MSYGHPRLAWWVYVLVSSAYTVLVFSGELGGRELLRAVKRDARLLREVTSIHIASISALVTMVWAATKSYPILPSWIYYAVRLKNGNISILEMILVAAGLGMSYLEGKVIISRSK